MEKKEDETIAQTTRRAYVTAYSLLDTTLDEAAIFAKLKKEQIPDEIATQVAADITLEREKRDFQEERPNLYYAIFLVSFAVIAAIVTAIFTDYIFMAIGFLLSGAIYIAKYYSKKPKA